MIRATPKKKIGLPYFNGENCAVLILLELCYSRGYPLHFWISKNIFGEDFNSEHDFAFNFVHISQFFYKKINTLTPFRQKGF